MKNNQLMVVVKIKKQLQVKKFNNWHKNKIRNKNTKTSPRFFIKTNCQRDIKF